MTFAGRKCISSQRLLAATYRMWLSNIAMATGAVAMNSQRRSSLSFTSTRFSPTFHNALERALQCSRDDRHTPASPCESGAGGDWVKPLVMPESDPRFPKVVRGHLNVHFVSDTNADKVFAHFAGDMGEHFVTVRQSHPKHSTGQNLCHCPRQFNWFFLRHAANTCNESSPDAIAGQEYQHQTVFQKRVGQ